VSLAQILQEDGSFQVTPGMLDQLAGGKVADGHHTLHLAASDTDGNVVSTDVTFNLDTTPPAAPVFDVAATDQFGDPSNHQTQSSHVTLVGQTDANDSLKLLSTSATTISSSSGAFHFANVDLNPGTNALTAPATDVAGNTSTYSLSVEQVAQADATNAVVHWNRIMLDAIRLDASSPPVASRGLAMESLAVLDAVNAINGTPGYLVKMNAPSGTSADAAVDTAAHKILSYLYPDDVIGCAVCIVIVHHCGRSGKSGRNCARRSRRGSSHCAQGQRRLEYPRG
jgi:Bacterial Ig-like domain